MMPFLIALLMSGCGYRLVPAGNWLRGIGPGMDGGTAWGEGSFDSNGEQIYFTGVNEGGDRIRYSGGSTSGMMMGGYLSCASCHGPDGRGGYHVMHMQIMDAPDIRWSALEAEGEEAHDDDAHGGEYDIDVFRHAVVEGEHPDGEPLSGDMPRWQISDADLADLMDYLQSLP
jgi:cytochrome c oxidase subunit 2